MAKLPLMIIELPPKLSDWKVFSMNPNHVKRSNPQIWKLRKTAAWYYQYIMFGIQEESEERLSKEETVATVKELLKNHSRKEIALFLGVSISAIDTYALGKSRAPESLRELLNERNNK